MWSMTDEAVTAHRTDAGRQDHPGRVRGRDFVMFFEEKEGTTPIIRLLNNFRQVEVVRARGEWEPFDQHACGPMRLSALRRCLDLVFSRAPIEEINEIYQQTSSRALSKFDGDCSLGFKMRFKAPLEPSISPPVQGRPRVRATSESGSRTQFSRTMIDVLRRHRALVFLAVRQDLLRWALSIYHGDGTGRPGHLQFQLASGKLEREEVPRIRVSPDALEETIEGCRAIHTRKRELAADLRASGLDVVPVRYEDFLADRGALLAELLVHLGYEVGEDEVRDALAQGIRLERVHGDDLSEFFVNAEELESRFGDRFEAWV